MIIDGEEGKEVRRGKGRYRLWYPASSIPLEKNCSRVPADLYQVRKVIKQCIGDQKHLYRLDEHDIWLGCGRHNDGRSACNCN